MTIVWSIKFVPTQGGHGTGKTGNLALTFSRQGKHREFCYNTGKVFETQGKYFWLYLLLWGQMISMSLCLWCRRGLLAYVYNGVSLLLDREGHGHWAVLYKSHFPPLRHSFRQRHHCIYRLINQVYYKGQRTIVIYCPTTWWQLGHKTLRSQEY